MAVQQLAFVVGHLRRTCAPTGNSSDSALVARFVRDRDEDTFAELVRRHGPLVLGVARRILGDVHAAEDAFQATFLLLARKAGRLRRPDRLGPWLHGVARRVALRARLVANRRREVPPVDLAAAPCADSVDLRPILDDAIALLPARDRTPIVLCYFEGLTYTEAARRLRLPPGTVSARLARARSRLRVLLTRRGLAPAASAVAAALAPECLSAQVSLTLRRAAVRAAVGTAAIPTAVLTLTKGLVPVMILDNLKLLVTAAVFGLAGGGAWLYGPAAAQAPAKSDLVESPKARVEPPQKAETGRQRTANFDVTAPTPEIARQVGEAAEQARRVQATVWLGKEMPIWPKRCPLYVTVTAGGAGGATKLNFDFRGNYEILSMELEGPLDKILTNCLPHEITHTVFAHYFRGPLPRWADEGAAVLAEGKVNLEAHEKVVRDCLSRQQLIPLRRLLDPKAFGEGDEVIKTYAEGVSLTRFLVGRQDRTTFLRFVDRGVVGGWESAVQTCYGFDGVESLETAWLAAVRAAGDGALREKPGRQKWLSLATLRRPQPYQHEFDTGDEFAITVTNASSQTPSESAEKHSLKVGEDGKVGLPLIPPITVRGQTSRRSPSESAMPS